MEVKRNEGIRQRPEDENDRAGFPDGFPESIDVPAARYTDPAFFALEQVRILSKTWQFVAHTEQLPNAGDFLRLEAFHEPIFLIRGDDGAIRAFYNSCQHRGTALINEAYGNKRLMVCPFHAWTYDRSGKLRGFPEAKNYPHNIRRECLSLKNIRCETFGPLVFINLDQDSESLRASLGPVANELDSLIGDKSEKVHFAAAEIKWVDGNWKLAGDANMEAYHVPVLHKSTASPLVDEARTGQWMLPKGHSRMLVKFRGDVRVSNGQRAPRLPPFAGLADNPLPLEGIYSFHLFPNVSIVMSGAEMYFVISAIPHGPSRMAYVVHYLVPVKLGGPHDSLIAKLVAFNSKVLDEDLEMIPSMQASMRAGSLTVLKLQYQERRIRRLHEDIDLRIGYADVPAAIHVPDVLGRYVEES